MLLSGLSVIYDDDETKLFFLNHSQGKITQSNFNNVTTEYNPTFSLINAYNWWYDKSIQFG